MAELYPASLVFIAFLLLQRGAELVLARRNTRRLLTKGAVEYGAGHYPLIVALHAAWLLAICIWGWSRPVSLGWLAVFAVLQLCRLWVLASLGSRWTTRIIVLNEPLVAWGPYRWVRILIHCKAGSDRTGLAAALYLASHGYGEARAERQISFRYGHVSLPFSAAWPMDLSWEVLEPGLGYAS